MTDPVEELLADIRRDGRIPAHIAVIMDGNGRWAKARALPRPAGHQAGMAAVREIVEGGLEAGVQVLTLFAFSQENWQRPQTEIKALMLLLEEYIARESRELASQDVTVNILGDLDRLSGAARRAVDRLMAETSQGKRLALNICISYGSRAEIVRAAAVLAKEVAEGKRTPESIDEKAMSERLYTARWPDPDLLIRTSGELRLSNFLLWQLAYAEFHVTQVLWPDFTRVHLYEAIRDYQRRERRFGRVRV